MTKGLAFAGAVALLLAAAVPAALSAAPSGPVYSARPNIAVTTTGQIINLDTLVSSKPGECCRPLNATASVAYLSSDQFYLSRDAECNSAFAAEQYPVRATHVWLCGCEGGSCGGNQGVLASTKGGEPCRCSREFMPVCFSGKTYSNRCLAKCDGAKDADIAAGSCNTPVTIATVTTSVPAIIILPSGQAVETTLPAGAFTPVTPAPAPGPAPGDCVCTLEYNPVCHDKKQYSNRCIAKCDGAVEAAITEGPCKGPGASPAIMPQVVVPATPSPPCVCSKEMVPVCYKGNTYSNQCLAKCAGAMAADIKPGTCAVPPSPGLGPATTLPAPVPKPPCKCTQEFNPVCSNRVTYDNPCLAICNGARDANTTPGPCSSSPPSPPPTLPTKPAVLPAKPEANATQPAVLPAKSEGNATMPAVPPAKPEANAAQPTVLPAKPEGNTTMPAVPPAKPEANATQPPVLPAPAKPEGNTTLPAVLPAKPAANATQPAVLPAKPEANATQPAVLPAKPGANATQPAVLPVAPAQGSTCVCTREFREVCFNGKTFSNPCLAKCEGATDATIKPGACPVPVADVGAAAAVLRVPLPAGPGSTDGSGVTAASGSSGSTRPQTMADQSKTDSGCVCTMEYRPVCVAGTKQYSNPCMARCAGAAEKDIVVGICKGASTAGIPVPMGGA